MIASKCYRKQTNDVMTAFIQFLVPAEYLCGALHQEVEPEKSSYLCGALHLEVEPENLCGALQQEVEPEKASYLCGALHQEVEPENLAASGRLDAAEKRARYRSALQVVGRAMPSLSACCVDDVEEGARY